MNKHSEAMDLRALLKKQRNVAMVLAIIASLVFSPSGFVHARMITTAHVLRQTASTDRENLHAFVQQEQIRQQLEALGVDPAEAAARVASLSDEEIRAIAGKLDELPAGQGVFASIIGVIVVILFVIVAGQAWG